MSIRERHLILSVCSFCGAFVQASLKRKKREEARARKLACKRPCYRRGNDDTKPPRPILRHKLPKELADFVLGPQG